MEELLPCDANEAQVHVSSPAGWWVKLHWASPSPKERNLIDLNASDGWAGGGRGREQSHGGVFGTCGWFHSLHGILVSRHCVCSVTFNNRRRTHSHAQVEAAHEFRTGARGSWRRFTLSTTISLPRRGDKRGHSDSDVADGMHAAAERRQWAPFRQRWRYAGK